MEEAMTLKAECDWGDKVRTTDDMGGCPYMPVVEMVVHVEGPEVPAGVTRLSLCQVHAARFRATPQEQMEYRE
jgi:hypothetical protein